MALYREIDLRASLGCELVLIIDVADGCDDAFIVNKGYGCNAHFGWQEEKGSCFFNRPVREGFDSFRAGEPGTDVFRVVSLIMAVIDDVNVVF